jgi:hypothetical protein
VLGRTEGGEPVIVPLAIPEMLLGSVRAFVKTL